MKDISLHIMDIVQNSIRANGSDISISIVETTDELALIISDNGVGMQKTQIEQACGPFYTCHPSKQTGLGIPLLTQAAEKTGGSVQIESLLGVGTTLTANFHRHHLDHKPLGDVPLTIALLLVTNPDIFFTFRHKKMEKEYMIDTAIARSMGFTELKEQLAQQSDFYQAD